MTGADGFHQTIEGNRRKFGTETGKLALGIVAILLFVAIMLGYYWTTFAAIVAVAVGWYLLTIRRLVRQDAERSKLAGLLRNRRLKINTKWGRVGAARKRK